MAKFTTLTSHAVPLPDENVDTDQIIPARFLKVTDKDGLGDSLFCDWRYLKDGSDNPAFVLNEAASQGAQILIAGNNFGSGSSREHAPWALVGWGFRAIISTGFADIFNSNSLKNGLLPVEVTSDVYQALMDAVQSDRSTKIAIDLATQSVTGPDGLEATFPIDTFSKHCLLEGIDQLGYLLSFDGQISSYEQQRT
ncbi:MAG: 3-isopropylmalate dehydratase small subunit [Deltaproteobacteria bacterium]|nr:3-isopropylmalate dehydratase small subunit [Deltaproteobacteria bacterium]